MIPGLCVVQCLVSCIVICRLLLVFLFFFFLAIVLLYVLLNTHLVCSHTHQWFKHVGQRNSTSITRNDIICIKLQKSTTWEHHHFTKRKIWAYKTISTPPLLWSTCAKPWQWAVMYVCFGYRLFLFLRVFIGFWNCSNSMVFLFFMLLLLVAYSHCIIIIGGILTLYYYYWWHTDIVLLLLVAYWHCILLCIGDVCQHNIV